MTVFFIVRIYKETPEFFVLAKGIVKRLFFLLSDFLLNPNIQKFCSRDIIKFCGKLFDEGHHETELEGKVINCLKKQFIKKTAVSFLLVVVVVIVIVICCVLLLLFLFL